MTRLTDSEFTVWLGACSHMHTDIDVEDSLHEHPDATPRESFAEAIRQSEGYVDDAPGFDWDIMLHLGDLNRGEPTPPRDEHGREVHRQWSALRHHRREQLYNLLGNHDASGLSEADDDRETQWWFQKWIDPTGERPDTSGVDTDARPFAVEGTWERYAFEAGNVLFLMMSDRNDLPPPIGRSPYSESSGFPAGAVTDETFEWWRDKVEHNQDKIIVTCHHNVLKDTTIASGHWEGIFYDRHGYTAEGAPEGSGYLYFVGEEPDAGRFESYLADNPGAIDLWLGGHTHAFPGEQFGNKRHVERKWGVTFANVAPMTKYHGSIEYAPLTRVLSFEPGESLAKLRCYLHTDDFAPKGWYDPERRNVPLSHDFSGLDH